MKNPFKRLYEWQKTIPEKKKIIELIATCLSVPSLITIILLNLNSLKKINQITPTPTPAPTSAITVEIKAPEVTTSTPSGQPVNQPAECKNEIGPISIVTPHDSEVINSNNFDIEISSPKEGYCPVVWSYRINNSTWSVYSDKVISLQNVSSGNKTLEIKVKNTTTNEEITLKRSFTVITSDITPTSTPTVTPTPTLILVPTSTPTLTITPTSAKIN